MLCILKTKNHPARLFVERKDDTVIIQREDSCHISVSQSELSKLITSLTRLQALHTKSREQRE